MYTESYMGPYLLKDLLDYCIHKMMLFPFNDECDPMLTSEESTTKVQLQQGVPWAPMIESTMA